MNESKPWWYDDPDNWRHDIPKEWRNKPLFDAPIELKVKLGLADFGEDGYERGDHNCFVCKKCSAYKECFAWGQGNCSHHQRKCGFPHSLARQATLEEFIGGLSTP